MCTEGVDFVNDPLDTSAELGTTQNGANSAEMTPKITSVMSLGSQPEPVQKDGVTLVKIENIASNEQFQKLINSETDFALENFIDSSCTVVQGQKDDKRDAKERLRLVC
nr:unnamed protein product [Callosobruchus analis]